MMTMPIINSGRVNPSSSRIRAGQSMCNGRRAA